MSLSASLPTVKAAFVTEVIPVCAATMVKVRS